MTTYFLTMREHQKKKKLTEWLPKAGDRGAVAATATAAASGGGVYLVVIADCAMQLIGKLLVPHLLCLPVDVPAPPALLDSTATRG